jgi:Tfp pilus assembly protein PilP
MPVAAINAARQARADVESAQRKNADALNPPAATPQTQAHPAVPAAAAGGSAPAPAPGTNPTIASAAPNGVYTYDAQGRRDPFVSLMNRGDSMRAAGAPRPPGVQGLLINEVTVTGILKTKTGLVAVVQGSDNKTYIVHSGDPVLDGRIKSIAQDAIVFAQDVTDPLSTVKQREVRKSIRMEAR